MAKKKFDPKAKAKRQKIIAAVGGVILIGVLAIQVPRTMKALSSQSASSSSSSSSSSSTTTASGTQPLAPPSLDGSATAASGASLAPAASTTPEGVSDPTSPLPPSAGQLITFSRFKTKDPFKQQIATACGGDATSANGSSCATTSSAGPKAKVVAGTGAAGVVPSGGAVKATQSVAVAAKPTSAIISVNGVASTVSVASSFPAGAPVFTLVSLTRTAAKIGIAGGSYENGAPTVTLPKGQTVTLMNTANGTRYLLRLVATA